MHAAILQTQDRNSVRANPEKDVLYRLRKVAFLTESVCLDQLLQHFCPRF